MNISELDLETLRTKNPGLVAQIEESVKASEAAQAESDEKIEALETRATEAEAKATEAEAKVTEVEKERDELQAKADEAEAKEQAADRNQKVKTMVEESDLDPKHVSEVFLSDLESLETDEEVQERIADRITLTTPEDDGTPGDNGQRARESEEDEEDDESRTTKVSASDEKSLISNIKRSGRKG